MRKEIDVASAKKAVLVAAFGICALPEPELFFRLEQLYWEGFKAGKELVAVRMIDSINEQFPDPLDP